MGRGRLLTKSSNSRRQLAEDRRHELGNRRMDRHHAGVSRSRDACRHRLDHPVDRLVAADAEDRGAEDRVGCRASTTTLMKPCVSPFSTARPTRVIGRMPIRTAWPFGAGLGLGQADPAERRIDVERVDRNAVAAPCAARRRAGSRRRFRSRCRTVWVKAPRPLQSPSAQMCGTLVLSSSSTTM